MGRLRTYGRAPFTVAVLHGGPGALGSMAAVARTLAADWGVLEPLQDALSIGAQVDELRAVLDQHAARPVTLVGSSWGAMPPRGSRPGTMAGLASSTNSWPSTNCSSRLETAVIYPKRGIMSA